MQPRSIPFFHQELIALQYINNNQICIFTCKENCMPGSYQAAIQMQRRYYTGTAAKYECMHAQESADDPMTRKLILSVLRMIDVNSLLDVGSATGRGLQDLAVALPATLICGVEPVAALVQEGVAAGNNHAVAASRFWRGTSLCRWKL